MVDVLIVGVLLATVALRVLAVAALTYLLLPRGGACPHCGTATTPVRSLALDALPVPRLERRWCLECGWHGVVRRAG
jgi:hypothetical protein